MLGLCGCPQASCSEWGLLSTWGVQVSHCGSFSCGAQALGAQASAVTRHGFSSCGTWAYLLCDMWDLPRSGIKPVSPALAGRFFTNESPGQPIRLIFFFCFLFIGVFPMILPGWSRNLKLQCRRRRKKVRLHFH